MVVSFFVDLKKKEKAPPKPNFVSGDFIIAGSPRNFLDLFVIRLVSSVPNIGEPNNELLAKRSINSKYRLIIN